MTGEKRVCRLWEKVFCINFCGGIEKIKAAVSFLEVYFTFRRTARLKLTGIYQQKNRKFCFEENFYIMIPETGKAIVW